MKNIFLLLAFLGLVNIAATAQDAEPGAMEIGTFNIHYFTENDDIAWATRKQLVLNVIDEYKFDLLGTQETYARQRNDIAASGIYGYWGLGVNTGLPTSGMCNDVFFRQSRFEVLDQGAFWLSHTPAEVSVGWDADQNRNCNWAKLKDKTTQKIFYYFVSHFDHLGTEARMQSARMICEYIPRIAGDYPAFFMGDLNCEEKSDPIAVLKEKLHDTRELSLTPPAGPYGTGHGWRIDVNVRRIDYIFTWNGNGRDRIEVQEYEVIDKTYDGKAPSDHWPVRIKARIVPGKATFRVTSSKDDGTEGTLRHALSKALPGDSIYVDRTLVDNIKISSPLVIGKDMSVNGNGASIEVEQPGVSPYRVFILGVNKSTVSSHIGLYNLKVKGGDISQLGSTEGNGGVMLIYKNTHLYAEQLDLSQGNALYGGAVFCKDTTGTRLEMIRCTFAGNRSLKNAGAVYSRAKAIYTDCRFENNITAQSGSALVNNYEAVVTRCSFDNNVSETTSATNYGAALFNTGNGVMKVYNSSFKGNRSPAAGCGAFASSDSRTQTTIVNSTFYHNEGAVAGAIYIRSGALQLINSSVGGNMTHSDANGAICLHADAGLTMINTLVAYNHNRNGMADMFVTSGAVTQGERNIVGCVGGGVWNDNSPVAFSYGGETGTESPLFHTYTEQSWNGGPIKMPTSDTNHSDHICLPLVSGGVAYRIGIPNVDGFEIPQTDQHGYTRYKQPCIGASEVIASFPTQLKVEEITGNSALLSWKGDADVYDLEYKKAAEQEWTRQSVTATDYNLTGLLPSTAYRWRVRTAADPKFPGEWLAGENFATLFGLTVTSALDDGGTTTLRYIIEHATPGDSILISKDVEVIRLTDAIELRKDIAINGQGATIEVQQPSVSEFRIFTVGNNLSSKVDVVKLYDMTLRGGDISALDANTNGGILYLYKQVNLTARQVIFTGGIAKYGGAIHCDNATNTLLNFEQCRFDNNRSVNNGGALYSKADATLKECVFENNKTADNGSALVVNLRMEAIDCHFKNNEATGSGAYGAAVFNTGGAYARFENCMFESNRAVVNGAGAFSCSTNGTTTDFVNCTFWGNEGVTASTLYNRAGALNMIYCTVAGNRSLTAKAAAILGYNAAGVAITPVNTLIAFNYDNNNVVADLARGGASVVVTGSNNLIGEISGAGSNNLQNSVLFSYGTGSGDVSPLFERYTSGLPLIPVLASNGGKTPTIALSSDGVAVGRATHRYEGFALPVCDQRGVERALKPCVGAYELYDEGNSLTSDKPDVNMCIYPNPTTDRLYISGDSAIDKVELYNLGGTLENLYIPSGRSISVADKPAGIYVLKVTTAEQVFVRKIAIK